LGLDKLIRAGAIFSLAGTVLLILLTSILLAYPIVKNCSIDGKCAYRSTAPTPLSYIIKPIFVAGALFIIATGIGLMRFAKWYKYKRSI
jgi:hypothetical protein